MSPRAAPPFLLPREAGEVDRRPELARDGETEGALATEAISTGGDTRYPIVGGAIGPHCTPIRSCTVATLELSAAVNRSPSVQCSSVWPHGSRQ